MMVKECEKLYPYLDNLLFQLDGLQETDEYTRNNLQKFYLNSISSYTNKALELLEQTHEEINQPLLLKIIQLAMKTRSVLGCDNLLSEPRLQKAFFNFSQPN